MKMRQVPVGPIGTNCYIVTGEDARTFVVDPGGDAPLLLEIIENEELAVEGVLVTHCHWDHIGAVAPVARATGAPVWMSDTESVIVEHEPNRFVPPGVGPFEPWPVEHKLGGGERIDVAGIGLEVLALPGHSPGSLGFFVAGEPAADGNGWAAPPVLFVGDLIFQGSVGRTDLPGADHDTLLASCSLVFSHCPDDTVLLSGHGDATTVGAEKRTNPFLRGLAAAGS
jgi:hydroxyacylglutathione hydrolase